MRLKPETMGVVRSAAMPQAVKHPMTAMRSVAAPGKRILGLDSVDEAVDSLACVRAVIGSPWIAPATRRRAPRRSVCNTSL